MITCSMFSFVSRSSRQSVVRTNAIRLVSLLANNNWFGGSILYEDNHVLVVNKPPTLLISANESGERNLLDISKEYIVEKYNKAGKTFLGLVHRLDKPCSGVVILARTSKAAARLSEAFRERSVDKTYVCIVRGTVLNPGRCQNYLQTKKRNSNSPSIRVTVKDTKPSEGAGRYLEASLVYSPLMTFDVDGVAHSVLEVDLHTGRKHQIRAQLAHIGHSICGDMEYGSLPWLPRQIASQSSSSSVSSGKQWPGQQGQDGQEFVYNGHGVMLHARSLSVPHPIQKNAIKFTAPLPAAWARHFGEDIVKEIERVMSSKSL